MIPRSLLALSRRAHRVLAPAAVGAMLLAGCSSGNATDAGDTIAEATAEPTSDTADSAPVTSAPSGDSTDAGTTDVADTAAVSDGSIADASTGELGAVGTLASSAVHDIAIEFDQVAFEAMVETYNATGDKDWITATVTIDGTTYEDVGLRLKGNSSLRGVTVDDDPATIPWLVKLDEFVDDQNHEGLEEFVIRSSSSTTALNEAVALELLDLAGLASQDAIATRLTVNGGEQVLRLVIDSPDGEWMAEEFSDTGALYKAESTGDWSYRGDDPASYDDVFDQEAGSDNADLTPLIEFLQFVNESDDATFAAELGDRLDVDSFATYLAMQDLLDNFDDINGPGNNAYLYYDTATEQFEIVPWDYNLAFGSSPMGGGDMGGGFPGGDGDRPEPPEGFDPGQMPTPPEGFDPGQMPTPPEGFEPGDAPTGTATDTATDDGDGTVTLSVPDGARPPDGDGGGFPGGGGPGGMNRENPLVDRFLANDEFNALYQQASADLQAALYDSGTATAVLDEWSSIVADSGLVDQATIDTESSAVATYFS